MRVRVFVRVWVIKYIHAHINIHTCVCIYIYVRAFVWYTNVDTHTDVYMYIIIYTHMYTYMEWLKHHHFTQRQFEFQTTMSVYNPWASKTSFIGNKLIDADPRISIQSWGSQIMFCWCALMCIPSPTACMNHFPSVGLHQAPHTPHAPPTAYSIQLISFFGNPFEPSCDRQLYLRGEAWRIVHSFVAVRYLQYLVESLPAVLRSLYVGYSVAMYSCMPPNPCVRLECSFDRTLSDLRFWVEETNNLTKQDKTPKKTLC